MNVTIRPMDIVIDGIIITVGILLYGKVKYEIGKIDGMIEEKMRKEKKGE